MTLNDVMALILWVSSISWKASYYGTGRNRCGSSSACGLVYCWLFIVSCSVLGSCLQFTERNTSVLSINTVHLFTRKNSSDVARRDILPSVRRYSLSPVKCRIRSCAILFHVAQPTPASHWTSASPLPQFHIQIRFPLTQHFSNDITVCRSLLIVGPSLPVDMP